MGWVESGRGWGERAAGWAYLAEPYARRVNEALSGRLGVVPGTRLADIACGSGYAANLAAGRGAVVSGLDASEALIAIARARTPAGDFRVGDMFALPFADDSFDAAASFNGIWKGCGQALPEGRRAVPPGGLTGFTFWGSPSRASRPGCCRTSRPWRSCHQPATSRPPSPRAIPGGPGRPGQMLADAGLQFISRGTAQAISELPDLDLAVRALAASGPSWPALHQVSPGRFAEVMREALRPLYTEGLGVRIISESGWIIGKVPGTGPLP